MTDKLAHIEKQARERVQGRGVNDDDVLALVNIAQAARGVSIAFAHLRPSGDNETGSPLALLRDALAALDKATP